MATEQAKAIPGAAAADFSAGEVSGKYRTLWQEALRRLLRNRVAVAGAVVIVVIIAMAFLAPYYQEYGPAEQPSDSPLLAGPSSEHWFGTDSLGRDMFARTMEGVRVSIKVGLGSQVIVLFLGLSVGALAAMGGAWADNLAMRLTDIAFAFPDLLLIILIRAVFADQDLFVSDIVLVIVAVSLVQWTVIARLVRGQMLSLKRQDYVIAAETIGAGPWRRTVRHMMPNTLGPVIVAITFGIPTAIFAEAALAFIGIGLAPPTASLGRLIADGRDYIQSDGHLLIFPAVFVSLLMLSFTFLGDGLRDALDPRTRS
jgi:oligopeptide transport system permease protein